MQDRLKDKIRGSLIGGAVGDALGYPVEFLSEKSIFNTYGKKGIQEYSLEAYNKKAIISDDTQMTLFTALAMIFCAGRLNQRGIAAKPSFYANLTYQDWLVTQEMTYQEAVRTVIKAQPDYPNGFISTPVKNAPELFKRRAPGITCLSALQTRKAQRESNEHIDSFIKSKINNSKGCGGVMRVAPVGLMDLHVDAKAAALEGAECAAVTHCHSLGYMPAAVLAQMIYMITFGEDGLTLKEITTEALETAKTIFKGDDHLDELVSCVSNAIELSENSDPDLVNIHRLGKGWVAEEALAIAIYCSLKYVNDFSGGIIASVNHEGDSDSTGAIAGNILGALTGYEAIDRKWKKDLELSDFILNVADMMCEGGV